MQQAAEMTAVRIQYRNPTEQARQSAVGRGIAGKVFTSLATHTASNAPALVAGVSAAAYTGLIGAGVGPIIDVMGNWINDRVNMRALNSEETAGVRVERLRTMLTASRLGTMHAAYTKASQLLEKLNDPDWLSRATRVPGALADLYELQDHFMTTFSAATLIQLILQIIEGETDRMFREYNEANMAFWTKVGEQNQTNHSQCRGTCYGPKPNDRAEVCKHPLGA
jgi:hypothetical protein